MLWVMAGRATSGNALQLKRQTPLATQSTPRSILGNSKIAPHPPPPSPMTDFNDSLGLTPQEWSFIREVECLGLAVLDESNESEEDSEEEGEE